MCGGTVGEEEGIKILISKAEGFDYRGWHGEIRLVQCYEALRDCAYLPCLLGFAVCCISGTQ